MSNASVAPGGARFLRVAINTPVNTLFDYLLPRQPLPLFPVPGVRVRVPFGRTTTIGIVAEVSVESDVAPGKLRHALEVLDAEPVIDPETVALLNWAAGYYRHPPGEVFAAALPSALRKGASLTMMAETWVITSAGHSALAEERLTRAPRQRGILHLLQTGEPHGVDALGSLPGNWRRTMKTLVEKGLAEKRLRRAGAPVTETRDHRVAGPSLTAHQEAAVDSVLRSGNRFQCFLLNGVTGSGKTEVYLRLLDTVVGRGRQALVLVPEIGLTPQLISRFSARLDARLAVLHSGLTDGERLAAYRAARSGEAAIVLGTRSAVFTALANPGVIIVDEEHDTSLKQQEGFRYSARDLAVARAKRLDVPVILGSATPSLESLGNLANGRYQELTLPRRPGAARPPGITLVDLRMHASRDGLSTPMLVAMEKHLHAGGQVLLYLNRRGFAPALFCAQCGWVATCHRCDARLTLHHAAQVLRCHHCGAEKRLPPACPDCAHELRAVGQGTERVEHVLTRQFAGFPIARIDRDKVRRRGELEAALAAIRSGATRILIGTQMLTKGHHFPDVTLVGILNADQGLFGTDFRASERLAQTIIQVSGRAGRAERPGTVLIQTEYPEHPLLQLLIRQGYMQFAEAALEERRAADWPPFSSLALLRAEAADPGLPRAFLARVRRAADHHAGPGLTIPGPAPAPMERRAGKYRAQLLFQAPTRGTLQRFLDAVYPGIARVRGARRVRWSLDIDPIELF